MKLQEQLNYLYEIQEKIRILQEQGLWEKLDKPKTEIIKLILDLENCNRIFRNAEKKLTHAEE